MILKPRREILVATRNSGKIREIRGALRSLPVKLRHLDEFPNVSPVEEVGQTYQENAVLKALGYSKQTGLCALADDSGLEVDALGGMPGVFSARFGGEEATDAERIEKLLRTLSEHPASKRTARFVCCVALAGWQGDKQPMAQADPRVLKVTKAICEGNIANAARGTNGFGFDPVFVPENYSMTFAELPHEVKATISHRALALKAMRRFLDRWLAQT
jgi:XTP/dITP diphosphohydrolase